MYRLALRMTIVVGALVSAAAAGAQAPQATIEIGSPSEPAVIGQTIEIPVILTSESDQPSVVLLFIEFDDSLVAYIDARVGPAVPEGKLFEAIPSEDAEGGLPTLGLAVFGIDQVPISDGTIFFVEFQVLAAPASDTVIRLVAEDFSAATPDADELDVSAIDGGIDLGCLTLEAPLNVQASTNRADGVLVTWAAVTGAAEYRVFRGAGDAQSPDEAAPISPWSGDTQFLDTTAPAPIAMGCALEPVSVRYWVLSREREFCEGPYGGPANGARALPPAKSAQQADLAGGMWPLALAMCALFAVRRRAS